MTVWVGVFFVSVGICFVVFNGRIAAKQMKFQRLVGSIWIGPKSLLFARVVNIVGGLWVALIGLLIIVHRIFSPFQ